MTKGLNEWAAEIHQNAVKHGWYEIPPLFPEFLMLCTSELAEALEEYRDENANYYIYYACASNPTLCEVEDCNQCKHFIGSKPSGQIVELADCIMRILDWCAYQNIDIEKIMEEKFEYNKTRPYRHGGKRV
ncbi:MAG: hypothetical protein FWF33_05300 [Clostridiales bacterium]|nr:hypothetical protein [Clostridiales bacterium]